MKLLKYISIVTTILFYLPNISYAGCWAKVDTSQEVPEVSADISSCDYPGKKNWPTRLKGIEILVCKANWIPNKKNIGACLARDRKTSTYSSDSVYFPNLPAGNYKAIIRGKRGVSGWTFMYSYADGMKPRFTLY